MTGFVVEVLRLRWQLKLNIIKLVPDPSPFEVLIAIAKLKRYKSPGSDQIPAELIQAGGEILVLRSIS
jgi:hypothetical protein